jgi:hypothetical protein
MMSRQNPIWLVSTDGLWELIETLNGLLVEENKEE